MLLQKLCLTGVYRVLVDLDVTAQVVDDFDDGSFKIGNRCSADYLCLFQLLALNNEVNRKMTARVRS